jgi:hypothetical protein
MQLDKRSLEIARGLHKMFVEQTKKGTAYIRRAS